MKTNKQNLEEEEIWKDIPKYEGLYQASNLGRIKSLQRRNISICGIDRTLKECILKPSKHKLGYLRVSLRLTGKYYYKNIHRLVMAAFHGESDLHVDHINGIKDDNREVNLRYVTLRENTTLYHKNKKEVGSYTGVSKAKEEGKWKASISIDKVIYHLGTYSNSLTAHNVYQNALFNWNTFKILPLKLIKQYDTSKKLTYVLYQVKNNSIYKILSISSTFEDAKISQKQFKQETVILINY